MLFEQPSGTLMIELGLDEAEVGREQRIKQDSQMDHRCSASHQLGDGNHCRSWAASRTKTTGNDFQPSTGDHG